LIRREFEMLCGFNDVLRNAVAFLQSRAAGQLPKILALIGRRFVVLRCFKQISRNALPCLQSQALVVLPNSVTVIGRQFDFGSQMTGRSCF
jgi:hypothetical protein